MYKLAKENGLIANYSGSLTGINTDFKFSNGKAESKWAVRKMFVVSEIYKSITGIASKIPGQKLDPNVSVGDFMRQKIESSFKSAENDDDVLTKKAILNFLHNWYKAEEVCDSWHDVSLTANMEYGSFGGDPYGGLNRGYQTVLDVILKDIPERYIQCNKIVTCINWGSDYVTVTTTDGKEYTADHVIVTVPLGYLKEHVNELFEPPLPVNKLDTIGGLGFGTLGKIFLEFEQPFWNNKSGVWMLCLLWEEEEVIEIDGVPVRIYPVSKLNAKIRENYTLFQ